jgi:hypothetical protein
MSAVYGPFYGSVEPPRVVAHSSGAVFGAWTVVDGGDRTLYIAFQASNGVGMSVVSLSLPSLAPPGGVEIVATSGTTAVLAWVESTPRLAIIVGQYSSPTSLVRLGAIDSAGFGDARDPRLATDGLGSAVAVWRQGPDGGAKVFANLYSASQSTWGTAVAFGVADAGNADAPDLFATVGTSFAVWSERTGGGDKKSVIAVRLAGTAWGDAGIVNAPSGESSESPTVVVSSMGEAVALWNSGAPAAPLVWSASANIGGTWSGSAPVGSYESSWGERPRAVIGSDGVVDAVWKTKAGQLLWSARNIDAGVWTYYEVVQEGDAGAIGVLRLARDSARHVFAVWEEVGAGTSRVRLSEREPLTGSWDAAASLGSDTGTEFAPDIAVDPSGNATVVWLVRSVDAGTFVVLRQKR